MTNKTTKNTKPTLTSGWEWVVHFQTHGVLRESKVRRTMEGALESARNKVVFAYLDELCRRDLWPWWARGVRTRHQHTLIDYHFIRCLRRHRSWAKGEFEVAWENDEGHFEQLQLDIGAEVFTDSVALNVLVEEVMFDDS